MARTIGKRNINKVRELTKKALKLDVDSVHRYVKDILSVDVFDTWEGAYDEIDRTINDTIME